MQLLSWRVWIVAIAAVVGIVGIGVVRAPRVLAEPDRASELEAWLRRERVVSFAANRHVVVLERRGAILVCVRAHEGEPVCVIERDPAVHDVFVTYDSFQEEGSFHDCFSWVEADGVRQWARWDRRTPGTGGACVEDYDVFDTRRDVGRAGRFATLTSERVPLYESLDHHAVPLHSEGLRVVQDGDVLCYAPPSGWVCTSERAHLLALAGRPESFTPISGTERYLVHTVEPHSHTQHHSLVLLAFEAGEVRVLDRLALGWTLVLGADPGPRFTWQLEADVLTLTPRASLPGEREAPRELAPRYRLTGGRFEAF
ncbi:MAG: hypothetical protein K1X94_06675 [Sandaracinaceae bacterium]|nr:hypothetical protein [Sandaracinaceae bacterium]